MLCRLRERLLKRQRHGHWTVDFGYVERGGLFQHSATIRYSGNTLLKEGWFDRIWDLQRWLQQVLSLIKGRSLRDARHILYKAGF